jgi:hypothetical protein
MKTTSFDFFGASVPICGILPDLNSGAFIFYRWKLSKKRAWDGGSDSTIIYNIEQDKVRVHAVHQLYTGNFTVSSY